MNQLYFTALVLSLTGVASTAFNFTYVFEYPRPCLPLYIEVYGRRVFMSFSNQHYHQYTIAWLSKENFPSWSRTVNAFPSEQMQGNRQNNCSALQDVRGLKVDAISRLWAVDNGLGECAPKLWIFDLTNQDSVMLTYKFPEQVALNKRWMADLVVDQSGEDWHAYIADSLKGRTDLVVFHLGEKIKSWRVDIGHTRVEALAISPLSNRKQLYFSAFFTRNSTLHSVSISDLRAGIMHPSVTFVGNKTASSRRLEMDVDGNLYFDLEKTFTSWDTNGPFKETRLFNDWTTKDKFPFAFAMDEYDSLWLVVIYQTKLRFMQLKTGEYTSSYSSCVNSKCQCPKARFPKEETISCTENGPSTKTLNQTHQTEGDSNDTEEGQNKVTGLVVTMICSNAFMLIILMVNVMCLYFRLRKKNETRDPDLSHEEPYDEIGPSNLELSSFQPMNDNNESEIYAEIDPTYISASNL